MNAERMLMEALSSAGFTACAEVPCDMPHALVTVERVGGASDAYVDRPRVAIQAWADTAYEASKLMEDVNAAVRHACEGMPGISSASLQGCSRHPAADGHPRYQSIWTFVLPRH